MEIFTLVMVAAGIYVILDSLALFASPARRPDKTAVFDLKWQRAIFIALYASFGFILVAALLLFILPPRLAWISGVMLIVNSIARSRFIRVAAVHAKNRPRMDAGTVA